jgi:hypothetical protein
MEGGLRKHTMKSNDLPRKIAEPDYPEHLMKLL